MSTGTVGAALRLCRVLIRAGGVAAEQSVPIIRARREIELARLAFRFVLLAGFVVGRGLVAAVGTRRKKTHGAYQRDCAGAKHDGAARVESGDGHSADHRLEGAAGKFPPRSNTSRATTQSLVMRNVMLVA